MKLFATVASIKCCILVFNACKSNNLWDINEKIDKIMQNNIIHNWNKSLSDNINKKTLFKILEQKRISSHLALTYPKKYKKIGSQFPTNIHKNTCSKCVTKLSIGVRLLNTALFLRRFANSTHGVEGTMPSGRS